MSRITASAILAFKRREWISCSRVLCSFGRLIRITWRLVIRSEKFRCCRLDEDLVYGPSDMSESSHCGASFTGGPKFNGLVKIWLDSVGLIIYLRFQNLNVSKIKHKVYTHY